MWSAISGFPNLVFDFDLGIEVYRTQFRLGLQLQKDLIKNIICSLEFTKAEPKLDINILKLERIYLYFINVHQFVMCINRLSLDY